MIEHDELTVIPNIKDPSKSTIHYKMGVSSCKERIALIWIDQYVDRQENIYYQEELKKNSEIKLVCIKNVDLAIRLFKKLNFRRIIIIVSGSLYQEFFQKFKSNLSQLAIVPKIIIFTSSVTKMKEKYGAILPLYHPFYNSHGIVSNFDNLKEELLFKISYNDYIMPSQYKRLERIRDSEKFVFEYIRDKNQLILPLFFSLYTSVPNDYQIQYFNKLIISNFGKNPEISSLFSQINDVKQIPMEILSKFWIKAYTAETDFYKKMNQRLMQNKNKEFITYIQVLYAGVITKALRPKNGIMLYRGGIISKKEYKLIDKLNNKRVYGLPGVIVYIRSFVSFTDNKDVAIQYKEQKKYQINNEQMHGLFVIQNPINENFCNSCAYINEYSFYQDESETLFFPFSCFEITSIKSDGKNEFIIYLNYLGKYANLFKGEDPKDLVERVPQQSTYAQDILNAKIIKSNIKPPKWFLGIENKLQQNKINNFNPNIQNSKINMQNQKNQITSNIHINQQQINNNIFQKSHSHNINAPTPKLQNKMKVDKTLNKILDSLNIEDEVEFFDEINNISELEDNYNIIEDQNLESQSDELINQIIMDGGMKIDENFENIPFGIFANPEELNNQSWKNNIHI